MVDIIHHLSTKRHSKVKGWCYAKKQTLADMLGISKRSIINLINKLEKINLVECTEDRKMVRSTELWEKEVIDYNFGGEESSPAVKKVHTFRGEESSQRVKKVHTKGEESSCPSNIDSNSDTNIDKYRKEIGGILPNIKSNWPPSLQKSVFEFLEYRQTLPKKDRMKTQRGWNAKISSFDNMLNKFGESDTVGAIVLSIEREWKNVSMDWYIRDKPQTKNLVQDIDTFILPDHLEKLFQKGKKEYELKEVSKRICYFKKEEFASWMVGGKNYEKKRDNGYLQKEIFGTIKDCINKLNTSPFHQRTTGRLVEFVTSAFKTGSGNIKNINR